MSGIKQFLKSRGQTFYVTLEISFAILVLAALLLLLFV